ncbi:MAG: helix-turn-helix transcriptional regulator [Maledivibacter sp.]|jgi:DNA-binding PadR family transcriptional regulator|nr:helix-turn-helix transcriptional regulator [Maledivibacter sp.]
MKIDKSLVSGSTTMLILKLLSSEDMYGYQMIEQLELRSENVFTLKAGTLYPLLHKLEQQGILISYEKKAENQKQRKYYSITDTGKGLLDKKRQEWSTYTEGVNKVLGGINFETF